MKFPDLIFLLCAFILGMNVAHAQLTIEITRGVEGALPIAVVPFGNQAMAAEDIAPIVAADLQRSGRFKVLSPRSYPDRPIDLGQVVLDNWRKLRVDHLVVGQIRPEPEGRYRVQFQLADVLQGNQLLGYSFVVQPEELRRVAHRISDLVYEKLIGEPGAFNTYIAYITATPRLEDRIHSLVIADVDGYNPRVILRSGLPLMSPAWSPDGNRLAYVSFENRKPQIFVQDVYSGNRYTVADYPGINGAPAWSPDGQQLALTLSKDGNPEIYLYNLFDKGLMRLTNNSAIDTEPAWSPDGQSIVFTSDRGGSPQLYRIAVTGGQAQRLTFEGNYNAAADLSPDGRYMTMVHRSTDNRFHIAVMDLQERQLRVLTRGGLDESPSFAPNGSMIIYATSEGGRGVLAVVSVDGRVRQRLLSQSGDVREPAWAANQR